MFVFLINKMGNRITTALFGLLMLLFATSTFAAVSFVTKPYLQNPTPDGMTVMWITDKKSFSWVEYGEDLQLSMRGTQSEAGLFAANNTVNKIRLTNLKPGTRYYYKVFSKEIVTFDPYKVTYGNTISIISYFVTPGLNDKQTSLLIMNDLHQRPESFGKLIGMSNQNDYDFVFFNGDIVNYISNESQLVTNLINPCTSIFASVKPFLQVRGNHETRGSFARNYFDYLQNPDDKPYYTFNRGPVFFIVLDSGEDKADDEPVYAGLIDFDAYRNKQAEWLEDVLQSPAYKNALYKVVLMHIPPLYSGTAHGATHCKELFVPIFNRYKIDLVISGHMHRYGLFNPVAGVHDFAVCIGGGPEDGKRTLIKLKADETMLDLQMLNDAGVEVGRYKINGKVTVPNENLVLYRLGDGSRELNTTDGYPVFLDEYQLLDTAINHIQTIALPTTTNESNKRFVGVGSSLNMGYMTRSADKQYLVVGGFDCNVGDKPWGKEASEVNRVVALVDADATIDTSTALNNVFNTKDIRSATSSNGNDIWVSGNGGLSDNGGVFYTTKGSSSAVLLNNEGVNTTTRNVRIFNNQLYVSRDTEVMKVGNNVPMTTNQTFLDITKEPKSIDASDFYIADLDEQNPGSKMVMYVTDAQNGVIKYSKVNENWWLYNGVYKGLTTPRAIEGFVSGGNVHLFIVCGNNVPNGDGKLYRIEDPSGYNQSMTGKLTLLLDYTGSKKTIRSIAWAPKKDNNPNAVGTTTSLDELFKVTVEDTMLCIESQLQGQANIFDLTGRKLKSFPVVIGLNKTKGFDAGQVVILKIKDFAQKVIF